MKKRREPKPKDDEAFPIRMGEIEHQSVFVKEGAMESKVAGPRKAQYEIVDEPCRIMGEMQWAFIREYIRDRDPLRAAAAAGYKNPNAALTALKKNPTVKMKMAEIDEAWTKNLFMTAQHAAAKHLDLMKKFEADYDSFTGEDKRFKPQMAGALMRGSELSLKATGHFDQDKGNSGVHFVINMDFGNGNQLKIGSENPKLPVIDAEIVPHE